MKHLFLMLILSLSAGPQAFATPKKSCTDLLQNIEIESSAENITLPLGKIISLDQIEGIDPFGIFEEGMDPENENPLSIYNESNGLKISIGGSAFKNEVDSYYTFEVRALEYSKKIQRFLVRAVAKDDSFEILININPKSERAHVYMREKKKSWSKWLLAAIYGNTSPSQAFAESDSQPTPRAPLSGLDYIGLAGDSTMSDGKQIMKLKDGPNGAQLVVYEGSNEMTRVVAIVGISDEIYNLIGSGDLAALDKKNFVGKNGSVEFNIDGRNFDGKPRVRVQVKENNQDAIEITGCNPWTPARGYLF